MVFEGLPFPRAVHSHPLPSLRAQTRNLLHSKENTPATSMLSKLVSLLLLFLLTACHSHRQSTDTIPMAQRRQQQLHYRDTLWSQLSLHLEHLTLEWTTDSMVVPPKPHLRLKADKAEVSLRQQTKTELQVRERQEDTARVERENHEDTEPTPRERAGPYGWLWLLLVLGIAFVAGAIMYRRR